jgi:PhnB protein
MKLNPHISLAFNGHCEAAFKFYDRCLGGRTISIFTWGNSPMANEAPPGWSEKVMHATMALGDTLITGSDVPPTQYVQPQGFEIMISPDDPGDAERLFQALSENGAVKMPIQKTFWSVRFGVLVDQFGIPWSINCEKSPELVG